MTFSAPTPIRLVCNLPAAVKARYDRSSMKRMIANAAPWSFALKEQYLADFPEDSLWEVYGSTELGVDTVLAPPDQRRKPGSCGQAAPGVEIKLFDEDGGEVTDAERARRGVRAQRQQLRRLPQGGGEVRRRTGAGDFLSVGDIAYRDEEGFYYICDRKSDMIISGGMNIYPAEIEAALERHPAVQEVAVFGIPSEEWGESVHAVVVARAGQDARRRGADDVRARASCRLQGAALDVVRRRAAEDRLGQDPQALAARAVLGGAHQAGGLAWTVSPLALARLHSGGRRLRAPPTAVLSMQTFLPRRSRLLGTEDVDGDASGVDRAGPAGIERHVGDQPLQLGLRHPVVQCPLHVAPHLVGAVERGKDRHRGQASVPLAEVGMLPDVAEQDLVAQLAELGDELVDGRSWLGHVSISSVGYANGTADLRERARPSAAADVRRPSLRHSRSNMQRALRPAARR